ncbi:hypothetical protein LSTR_LSTR000204 [Laodelphax striatellus]|uniref:Uncharacterized protein n=1 Tax=Laodelphax striatellus TaxID=195883 RepID=A0A482X7T1_LAOST|nr:hypothetical protein LSTR_LSTR000204 [Laodelphax striatellus]
MESLLPLELVIDISCFIANEDSSLRTLDKDAIDITVCTRSGEVIEFSNKKIINSCRTKLLNASSINIFYAYKPFKKYYIIQEDAKLSIIDKKPILNELKVMENISKYEIADFLGFGFPQLKVWFHDELETLLTDFSNCWSASDRLDQMPRLQSNLTRMLDTKLQMMNMRLDEARKLHDEKRRCRTKALHNVSSKTNTSSSNKSYDIGNLDKMTEYNKESNGILKLEILWQKTLDECWLICVLVLNSSQSLVADDLHLHLMSDDGEFKYKSLVIALKESGKLEISNSMEVPPRCKSVIIGVIDIPCFRMKNCFSVTGMLSYKLSDGLSSDYHQITLPRLTLGTHDLVKGDLIPFSNSQVSVQDIAAIMAVFEKSELEVILPEKKDINIEDIMYKLHYSKTTLPSCPPCYVSSSIRSDALSQSILFWNTLSENVHIVICYTRNDKQLLLLSHSLLSILPHKSQVLKKLRPTTSLDNAIEHLGSEISFLTESLRSHILPSDGPLPNVCELKFKANFWEEMRQKMSTHELQTDLTFQALAT